MSNRRQNTNKIKIRVLVVDDHPAMRHGLELFISQQPDMQCIGLAENAKKAVSLAADLKPDVVILDIAMPDASGIDAITLIRERCKTCRILILSAYSYEAYVVACMELGVSGYITKKIPISELVDAIRIINVGEVVFDEGIMSKIQCYINSNIDDYAGVRLLNNREREILHLCAKGLLSKQMARYLHVSERTVQSHLSHIYRKLDVNSRAEALVKALKEGWLVIDDIAQ